VPKTSPEVPPSPSIPALPSLPAKPTPSVNGRWHTSDGTVAWEFRNGTVRITALGLLTGMIDATGTYQINGDSISGTFQVNTMYYLPVNTFAHFTASVDREINMMTGQIVENISTITPIALYRNS
jgi:hypothetical protein